MHAVLRWDGFHDPIDPEICLTVREILPTEDKAEREVERLNGLARAKGSDVWCWHQPTRFFPQGRGIEEP